MAHPFGKPIGIAAQVKKGKPIFTLKINKENLELGRSALKRAGYKLPTPCTIIITQNNKPAKSAAKPAPAAAAAAA
jgi:large subunit ribosomal protein L10e